MVFLEKLYKMCPHYDRLLEIHKGKTSCNLVVESSYSGVQQSVIDVNQINESNDNDDRDVELLLEECIASSSNSPNQNIHGQCSLINERSEVNVQSSSASKTIPGASREFAQKLKTRKPLNSLSELLETQQNRSAYYEKRLKIEEDKLELEREKMQKEYELKKIELEQKERLAVLELKYKYNKEQ